MSQKILATPLTGTVSESFSWGIFIVLRNGSSSDYWTQFYSYPSKILGRFRSIFIVYSVLTSCMPNDRMTVSSFKQLIIQQSSEDHYNPLNGQSKARETPKDEQTWHQFSCYLVLICFKIAQVFRFYSLLFHLLCIVFFDFGWQNMLRLNIFKKALVLHHNAILMSGNWWKVLLFGVQDTSAFIRKMDIT